VNETDGNLEPGVSAQDLPDEAATASQEETGAAAETEPVESAPAAETKGDSWRAVLAIVSALAGWAVPGLGHALLKRWGRALGFFVAVGGLAVAGALMRGFIFDVHSDDPFGRIGFYADASTGVFYTVARLIERAGPDLSRAAGEFGTRFIATAGVVNLLSVLDAFEIARGRRN
jgi:hypothetical protein